MVRCLYSLESPRWGDSNENTNIQFQNKTRKFLSAFVFLSYRKNSVRTQKWVRISHGKRVIGVRAIGVRLYLVGAVKIWVKGHTKRHDHVAQLSRCTNGNDEEEIMTKQTPHMKPSTHKENELQQRNRIGMVSRKLPVGCRALLNITLNSYVVPITNIYVLTASGYSKSSVKHHSETHIIKNSVIKQSKGLNGDLKPEDMITTNMNTIGPTLTVRRQPSETDWGNSRRRAIKEESKVIKHNLVNSHACSLPQNIHVVTFCSEWQSFKIVPTDQFFQQSFWIYRRGCKQNCVSFKRQSMIWFIIFKCWYVPMQTVFCYFILGEHSYI